MAMITGITITTSMADTRALQRLLAWASPAYPVGGFAYSAGLETAIADGRVSTRAQAQEWIEGTLRSGGARNDAILLAHAHRAFDDAARLGALSDLCLALTPASERHHEATAMGEAFILAAEAWPSPHYAGLPSPCAYPIAFGAVAAAHRVDAQATLIAFLTAFVQAQISVAVRLVPIGQSEGLAILSALETAIGDEAETALRAPLEAIGGAAYAADIAQMQHETLATRIFKS
ncbi:urease accessory protein UreF [Nitratireductor sp. ZSWI3]|uniref:urease accessory protein UreF n=1 Tax=Nitratireductor sp. ZSWI3 TaxID=2966359 RepID=UPI00214FEB8C|nr:urease accessory protein UreF [Nitratireductor sp. ZSWI3]MCR4266524.1 urease accessory protein UreF [Nitratireductor sp. ZSWI3]